MIADAALGATDGGAAKVFTNGNAKRESNVQAKFMFCRVDFREFELQTKMQKTGTGLPAESLADHSRAGRLHSGDAQIKQISPPRRLRKQFPNYVNWGIDHNSGATRVCH
jgi:hypothetical protein